MTGSKNPRFMDMIGGLQYHCNGALNTIAILQGKIQLPELEHLGRVIVLVGGRIKIKALIKYFSFLPGTAIIGRYGCLQEVRICFYLGKGIMSL